MNKRVGLLSPEYGMFHTGGKWENGGHLRKSRYCSKFGVTRVVNKLGIAASKITCSSWHRKLNTVFRNETKLHCFDRHSPYVHVMPVTIAGG